MAQDISEKRRVALRRFLERRSQETGRSQTQICKDARVAERTVGNFLNADVKRGKKGPKSMTLETYDKLAASEGVNVCELLGETAPAPKNQPAIDLDVMTMAFDGWNFILQKKNVEPRVPEVDPANEAKVIANIYSILAGKSPAERESWRQDLVSNFGFMVSLTEIIPPSGSKSNASRHRDDKAIRTRKSGAAAGDKNG